MQAADWSRATQKTVRAHPGLREVALSARRPIESGPSGVDLRRGPIHRAEDVELVVMENLSSATIFLIFVQVRDGERRTMRRKSPWMRNGGLSVQQVFAEP